MDINKLIQESIDNYIKSIITEKKKTNSKEIRDSAKKRDGNNVSSGDEAQIKNDVMNNDLINVAALARLVYPDHTPEGAQSQLRKKLEGEKNDNGSQYHIKQREASAIRKALNKI